MRTKYLSRLVRRVSEGSLLGWLESVSNVMGLCISFLLLLNHIFIIMSIISLFRNSNFCQSTIYGMLTLVDRIEHGSGSGSIELSQVRIGLFSVPR